MSDEKSAEIQQQAEEVVEQSVEETAAAGEVADNAEDVGKKAKKAKKPKKKKMKLNKKLGIVAAVIIVIAIAGGGFYKWHEQPSFCSTMCHLEQTYVDNYMQEQGVEGVDKYGNAVSNTNAMMAVLHRETDATAMPEVLCVDCHVPNYFELGHDGIHLLTGNYSIPRNERTATAMKSWDKEPGESFCANENCHVYLLGDDGLLSYDKLEASTAGRAFNPHEREHANLSLDCTACHKGHRASTIVCTGCHEHADVELPDGWVSYKESQQILVDTFNRPQA